MARPPGLLDPGDARQDLLRDGERIFDRVEFLQAPVTGAAAGPIVDLTEILDQRTMPAAGAGRVALHVAQQQTGALVPLAIGFEHLLPANEIRA